MEEYESEEESGELPPDLADAHRAVLLSLKKADLRESGAWALSIHMDQAAEGFALLRQALKNIMCIIYDLSRTGDKETKLEAVQGFVELQLMSLDMLVEGLLADIDDTDSSFHTKQRKEFTAVLHELHRLIQEGVAVSEAYVEAVERYISDPEHKKQMLDSKESAVNVYGARKDNIIAAALKDIDKEPPV